MIRRYPKGTIYRAQLDLAIAVRHLARDFWRPLVRRFGLRRGPTAGEWWQAMRPIRLVAYVWYVGLGVPAILAQRHTQH